MGIFFFPFPLLPLFLPNPTEYNYCTPPCSHISCTISREGVKSSSWTLAFSLLLRELQVKAAGWRKEAARSRLQTRTSQFFCESDARRDTIIKPKSKYRHVQCEILRMWNICWIDPWMPAVTNSHHRCIHSAAEAAYAVRRLWLCILYTCMGTFCKHRLTVGPLRVWPTSGSLKAASLFMRHRAKVTSL